MHDLDHISEQLFQLFQTGQVPEELADGGALRCPLDEVHCIQLRFQPQRQCWMLGVDQSLAVWDEASQAQVKEALLRVAHTSRWTAQKVAALEMQDRISLVDCDFPGTPLQAVSQATAAAIEGRLRALLHELKDLTKLSGNGMPHASEELANSTSFGTSATNDWLKA